MGRKHRAISLDKDFASRALWALGKEDDERVKEIAPDLNSTHTAENCGKESVADSP